MFRVLQVVTYMGRGGLETMLMNYYRHMDRSRIQFDFLVHRDFQADYDGEIESLGRAHLPGAAAEPVVAGLLPGAKPLFSSHPYPVVHSHLDCMSAYPLRAAKRAGAPVRIAHAHNTNQDKELEVRLEKTLQPPDWSICHGLFRLRRSSRGLDVPGENGAGAAQCGQSGGLCFTGKGPAAGPAGMGSGKPAGFGPCREISAAKEP